MSVASIKAFVRGVVFASVGDFIFGMLSGMAWVFFLQDMLGLGMMCLLIVIARAVWRFCDGGTEP